jgi:hypothetical protein
VRSTNVADDELTLLVGTSILNSEMSQTSGAASLEYRHGLARDVDVTATYLHEAVASTPGATASPPSFG